ncbi:MAG: hypothetical protein GXO99_08420 [Nitrospirae bacterium]|nr:hypothetical protein [Nitrospirota bacterium]
MNKLILFIALAFLFSFSVNLLAQEQVDVVYLKDGSKIIGIVIEQIPDQSIKIQTRDGSEYVYTFDKIEKITKEYSEMDTSPYQQKSTSSFHVGFLYNNGVDLLGYTVERKLTDKLFFYYTFGIPALAATGISYYDDYHNNGFVATAGIGIGFLMYSSLSYQWRVADRQYIKIGAGYGMTIESVGPYPVLSYEYRFK